VLAEGPVDLSKFVTVELSMGYDQDLIPPHFLCLFSLSLCLTITISSLQFMFIPIHLAFLLIVSFHRRDLKDLIVKEAQPTMSIWKQ